MTAIVHDIVRAVLTLVVLSGIGEMIAAHKTPPPPVYGYQMEPRPIQRVGRAGVELAESVLGIFR